MRTAPTSPPRPTPGPSTSASPGASGSPSAPRCGPRWCACTTTPAPPSGSSPARRSSTEPEPGGRRPHPTTLGLGDLGGGVESGADTEPDVAAAVGGGQALVDRRPHVALAQVHRQL